MSVFPREAGYPDYASNSAAQFIPKVYAKKLLEKFYASVVYSEIASTEYEG